jgi:hypothetical protein
MHRALAAWQETGNAAGTGSALFGVSLVFQVLRRDWDAGMPYLWQAFGLAEAVEESGDLYGASEIRRHLGFYYLHKDIRPKEAVRQLGIRSRFGSGWVICAGCQARWSRSVKPNWPRANPGMPRSTCTGRWSWPAPPTCFPGGSGTPSKPWPRPRQPSARRAEAIASSR